MSTQGSTSSEVINVLVADSNQMQCQLLTAALRRRPEFRVISGPLDPELILKTAAEAGTQGADLGERRPGAVPGGWPDSGLFAAGGEHPRHEAAHPARGTSGCAGSGWAEQSPGGARTSAQRAHSKEVSVPHIR